MKSTEHTNRLDVSAIEGVSLCRMDPQGVYRRDDGSKGSQGRFALEIGRYFLKYEPPGRKRPALVPHDNF